jgi:hypothetical protein
VDGYSLFKSNFGKIIKIEDMDPKLLGHYQIPDSEFSQTMKNGYEGRRHKLPHCYAIDFNNFFRALDKHPLLERKEQMVFEIDIKKEFRETLNGLAVSNGFLAFMIDELTSTAVFKNDSQMRMHVSMMLTFKNFGMENVKTGDKLILLVELLGIKDYRLLTKATLYSEDLKNVLVVSSHAKVFSGQGVKKEWKPLPKL